MDTYIAAPLSHGSNPNSNAAGRRREDDENLVTSFHNTQDPISDPDVSLPLGRKTFGMGVMEPLRSNRYNNSDPGMEARMHVYEGASVRRLMPVEGERLQALPDGWTDLGGTADSKRYAALGDAVTASVAEWIGRRLLNA